MNGPKQQQQQQQQQQQHLPQQQPLGVKINKFNSRRIALVHQCVIRFIVLEVKLLNSSSPKAKAIQSRVL